LTLVWEPPTKELNSTLNKSPAQNESPFANMAEDSEKRPARRKTEHQPQGAQFPLPLVELQISLETVLTTLVTNKYPCLIV
jgi:hypothetical protein